MPKYRTYDDVPVKKKYKTYDDVKVKTHWEEDASQPLDGDSAANNPIAPALILAKRDGNVAAAKELLDNAPYVQAGRDGINSYADAVAEIERQDDAAKAAAVQATMQPMGYGGLSKALRDGSMPKKKNTKVKETRREGNPKYNDDYVPGVNYPKFRPYDDVEKELADVQARRDTDFNTRFPEAKALVQRSIGGKDADADRQLRELAQQYADENAAYDARIAELKKESKDSKNKTVLQRRERAATAAKNNANARYDSAAFADLNVKISATESDTQKRTSEYDMQLEKLRAERDSVAKQRDALYSGAQNHSMDAETEYRFYATNQRGYELHLKVKQLDKQIADTEKKRAQAINVGESEIYRLRGAQTLATLPEASRRAILIGAGLGGRASSVSHRPTARTFTKFNYQTGEKEEISREEWNAAKAEYDAALEELKAAGVSKEDIERMISSVQYSIDEIAAAKSSVDTAAFAIQNPGASTLSSAASVITSLSSGLFAGVGETARAIGNIGRADGYKKPMNINGAAYAPTRMTNDIRGTIAERIEEGNGFGGKVGSFAYQTLMSTADSVVASVLGNAGGAAAIGGSAFASAIVDAKESGVSDEQALMTGICAGIFETLFERVSIGNFNKLKEVPPATLRDVALNIVKSTVVNASEEGATEIANIAADCIINGDYSGYAEAFNAYINAGKSEDEAARLAVWDMIKQVSMAAFGGAVQGFFMGGIGTTWGYFGNRDANRAAGAYFTDENGRINAENRNALIGEGLASGNEEIRAYAGTLEDKRTMSRAEAGQLYRMLVAETQGNYAEEKVRTDAPAQATDSRSAAEVFNDANSTDRAGAVSLLRASIPTISGMKSVASISGLEIPKGGRATERLLAFAEKIGNAVTRGGFGTVLFSKTRLKNSVVGHGASESKIELFAAVPFVISDGVQISKSENWKGRGYDSYVFAAPVDYKEKRVYVTAIVTRGADNRYYLHEAVDSEGNLLYGHEESPALPSDRSAEGQNTVANAGLSDSAKGSDHELTNSQPLQITPEATIPYSTDTDSIAQTAADSQVFPDFSDRSLDEPISETEFRAAYAARVAREAAAERAKTQADTDLGNMLSGELTNGRADEIAKSQSLANAFEALTGEKLTGTLAEKRKQLKAMQTFATEKLRDARADARMTALKTADTREKMRAAVGTAGQAVYDAGYAAGVAAYKLRGFAGDALLAPSELYNANFGAYYRQGYQGDAFDFSGNAVIGEADARRIFEAGRRDAKADTYLNAAERSAFEHGVSAEEGATARRLSQVLGREILFIDADADFHGCTIDGVIYLGAKSERSVLATVAHEYTHLLESKGLYKKLRDFVFDTLAGEGATAEDLRAAKRAEHELYAGLDDEKVDREIVAEFVETRLLTDEQVMREVVRREGKSFARRLLDTLRGLVEKVKAALHIGDADAEQLKMLERGRDILAEVIRSEEVAEKTAVSFDLEQAAFEKQLDDWKDGLGKKYGSYNGTYFNLGTTPSVLVKHGAKQVPVIMYEDCLVKITGGKHSISLDEIKKLPEQLNDPILLFKGSVPDSFVALTEMETKAGHDVVVAVHINRYLNRTVVNKIASMYSKSTESGVNRIAQYISAQIESGNLVDASAKKAPTWFTSRGLQLPKLVQTIIDADTTVSQNNSGVNSKYTQNSKNDAGIDGFSVGGVNAKTAEVGRLADAERMEQGGADSETVRRETGWYRGYDGKWRFEIDDSKMRFINHREESRRTWKLDELIRHDALFAAYPELRNYTVLNFGIADGVEATFYPGLNRITLDPQLNRAEKRAALIHEIQHAIQVIEGFAAGSSTDYWQDAFVTDAEKRTERHLQELAWKNHQLAEDMYKLLRDTPDARRDALRATFVQRHGEKAVREFTDTYNHLLDLQKQRTMRAERAYRDTAGEIEAADVANRLGLSAKQRAETRPDIDRTNVRFSNEHPMFTMKARQTDSEGIMKLDDANIDKTKEKMTWLEANDLLEKQQGLSYRFYASDDPMSRAGYAMFADDHEQNGSAYGGDKPRAFSVREDDLTPVWELSEKIAEARHETDEHTPWILEDYAELSDEDFADMFNPSDIVDSAYAWDNEELTEWFYNHVAEPNKIGGVKTSDGAIVFDKDLIRRNIPAEIAYTQASSNEEFLAKYGDDTEADPDIRFSAAYENAEANNDILALVNKIKSGEFKDNDRANLGIVTDELAARIAAITHIDVAGYKVVIEARMLKHILKDHGAEGYANRSMQKDADIAKMQYALSDPDDMSYSGKTTAYSYMKEGYNRTAPTILYEKSVGDNSYYVVQAVPETKAKTLYVVSAFIGEKGYKNRAGQPADIARTGNPDATPANAADHAPKKSISNSVENVNTLLKNDAETDADIRFSVGDGQTDADAEVSGTDKRFAPVESAIKLLQGGADLWRTLRETGASPREIALRMATSGESDTAIRELTGLYRDALGVWTYDKAWFDAHVPDIADTRELRAGYKLGTVDEQLLGLAPEEVKASRRRLLDSAKLPADTDAARVRQTAANLHRGLRPTAAEFAEDRKTAAAKEAARLITAEKVPSADAAIRTGALLADIADVLEKKKVRAETVTRLTAQVRGENGAWETDNAAMTKIIRAGSKQLDVQDFTDFLFENAKELTESSYNSQYGHKETYALDKLGVQIQNPIVDIAKYGTKPSELIANEREQEELKRYIENEYAHAAHPSPAERADARDVATGIRTLGQISQDSRREVVLDLVYANLARRGLRDNGIETFYMVQKQRYAEELAQNIFKVSIEPGKKAVQQWRLTANTALRNNRMVFGEEVGRYLNETIFEKVVENEAERQRFMQREIDKIRKLKLTKLESQAVQMLAEDTKESRLAFYELLKGKGKNLDVEKCRAAVTVFRECYNLYYDAINEFLVMHGYKPIGFQKNYMPRLQKEADVSALRERLNALGIETEEVTELPAEIAGRTETFKPGKKYNPFFEHRTSKENKNVQYDALGGFDSYITYLSEVLYHTDDIQKLRTLAGALRERYASGAVSKNIAELKEQLYSPDPDKSFADIEAKLTAAYDEVKLNNYFGTYATWLDDYTNNIAGKQTSFDRAFEYNIGRKTLNLGKRLNNTYSAAVIVGNLSSAFNQTVQLPFALTECGIRNMTRAFVDMLPGSDRLNKTAEFDKKSTFLAGKRGVDYASERAWNEKVTAAGGKFFESVDMTVTRLILRAKYYQVTEANPNIGFDAAVREADRYISAMVGNRMKGSKPVLFNQKNVITRTLTAFQLEQLNFAEYVARDVPAKYRAYYKAHGTHATVRKIARELISALINVFVFNRLAELLYGQTPAAGDALGILVDSLGAGWNLTGNDFLLTLADDLCRTMTGERKLGTRARGDFSVQSALGEFGDEVGDDVPLVNNILAMLGVTNSKLPLPQVKAVTKAASGDFKGAAAQIPSDLATWVPFGSQVKKTARGVKLIADKGMYSSSGKLMFASDMNVWDSIRAVLFGPTANEEYRESFFGGRYLSAEETELWQQMRAAGGKPEESFNALQDVYNAGAAVREDDPDAPSAEVKAAKVEKIDDLPLNGRLKALLLYGDVATTNEKAVMDALEVTLQVDHMKVYRFMSGFVLREKVADKREYLKHDLILTDAEKATVYYHYFANDDAQDFIDELRRRGGKDADIYKVLAASYDSEGKVGTADRATAIADSSLPASAKEEAMYELISDELHDKYTAVQDAGGSVDEFLAAYAATHGITSDKDRAGNTVALSKARKMKKAIDAAVPDAPKKVRRALYSAFGVSKSVWY